MQSSNVLLALWDFIEGFRSRAKINMGIKLESLHFLRLCILNSG